MSKIYCGIGKVPKGKQLGTMAECLESHQVGLFGLYKIDPKLLEKSKKSKKSADTKSKLQKEIIKSRSKILKLEKDKKMSKDEKQETKISNQIKKEKQQFTKLKERYAKINKN